jgi:hypothetical protein
MLWFILYMYTGVRESEHDDPWVLKSNEMCQWVPGIYTLPHCSLCDMSVRVSLLVKVSPSIFEELHSKNDDWNDRAPPSFF